MPLDRLIWGAETRTNQTYQNLNHAFLFFWNANFVWIAYLFLCGARLHKESFHFDWGMQFALMRSAEMWNVLVNKRKSDRSASHVRPMCDLALVLFAFGKTVLDWHGAYFHIHYWSIRSFLLSIFARHSLWRWVPRESERRKYMPKV